MTYYFNVSATFMRIVGVEADNHEEAMKTLQEAYNNKELELKHYCTSFRDTEGNKKDTRFGEPFMLNCADTAEDEVACANAEDDADNCTGIAKEKMVVFRCKYCIDDLKEYNPYINKQGESIALENIICVEVSDEACENTTFELKPILLDQANGWYSDIPNEEQIILLNRAIEIAKQKGYAVCVKVWDDYYAREEGLPFENSLESYLEDFDDPESPAAELLSCVDGCYCKGGCVEIVAKYEDHELYFYHQENYGSNHDDEYFLDDMFELIQAGGEE